MESIFSSPSDSYISENYKCKKRGIEKKEENKGSKVYTERNKRESRRKSTVRESGN
jgi:hypothetical protein